MTKSLYKLSARIFTNPIRTSDDRIRLRQSFTLGAYSKNLFISTEENPITYLTVDGFLEKYYVNRSKGNVFLEGNFVIEFPEVSCREVLLSNMRYVQNIKNIVGGVYILFKVSRITEDNEDLHEEQIKKDNTLSRRLFSEKFYSEIVYGDVESFGETRKRWSHDFYLGYTYGISAVDVMSLLFILKLFRYPDYVNDILNRTGDGIGNMGNQSIIMHSIIKGKVDLNHGYTSNDNFLYIMYLYYTIVTQSRLPWANGEFNGIVTYFLERESINLATRLLSEPYMKDYDKIPEQYEAIYKSLHPKEGNE